MFKLGETGINEIKINSPFFHFDKDIFLIFTCGEDCTLVIGEFIITNNINNILNIINKIKNI